MTGSTGTSHCHPVYRAPLGMPSGVENRFPGSQAFTTGNRKQSPRCEVWAVRRVGQLLHRNPPQKIHCQMGVMGRSIVMVQQDVPQSSSWALFSQFLGNLWECKCGVPLCSHCPLLLKWYVATRPPAAKKVSTIFFPTLFALFTLTGRSSLGNPQTDE